MSDEKKTELLRYIKYETLMIIFWNIARKLVPGGMGFVGVVKS